MINVYANKLEVVDGKVTGNVTGQVVDGARKAELLRSIAQQENISLEQSIAVGDGANDLPMLSNAGLGIAFEAKPIVKVCWAICFCNELDKVLSSVDINGEHYLIFVRCWLPGASLIYFKFTVGKIGDFQAYGIAVNNLQAPIMTLSQHLINQLLMAIEREKCAAP